MARRWSGAMLALGVVLVANLLLHAGLTDVGSLETSHLFVDIVGLGGSVAAIAYGSRKVDKYTPELARRVIAWTLSAMAAAALLGALALYAGSSRLDLQALVHVLQLVVPLGTVAGLAVGVREARFVETSRDAERAQAQAASLVRQRQTLEQLNAALRHHILNDTNVIAGSAELLREAIDDENVDHETAHERLDAVQDRSARMAATVDRVRILIQTATDNPDVRPIDSVHVVNRELERARETYPDATIKADLPEEAPVKADELFSEALHELLANALEHAGNSPTVDISVTPSGGRVLVRVSDDGEGLEREQPFDFGERGDEGLGLYIVESIVERYGEVTVEEGSAGTTIRLDMEAA